MFWYPMQHVPDKFSPYGAAPLSDIPEQQRCFCHYDGYPHVKFSSNLREGTFAFNHTCCHSSEMKVGALTFL